MRHGSILRLAMVVAAVLLSVDAAAQEALTLADAMQRARSATPTARALAAAQAEAEARVTQARAGYFPRVDFIESIQRGNHPVFVFSSLLAQRQFTAARFQIDALNHPAAVNNIRSALTVEQPLFDAGQTRLATEAATLSRNLAAAAAAGAEQDLALAAAQVFVRVLQLDAVVRATRGALVAAESDRARARNRRDAGLVTEADVLDVEVHVADMQARHLSADADLAVARMRLNDAMGAPLDAAFVLVAPSGDVSLDTATPPAATAADTDRLVRDALLRRFEKRDADIRVALSRNAISAARAAWLPRVAAHAGWESNGERFPDQRSSWIAGAQVQLNIFRGFADAARLVEARHASVRAAADRQRLEGAIELDVRAAAARLQSARARARTGEAALANALESQRIIRDRYDTGLANIGDVLRAAGAVLEAESRMTAARTDVIAEGLALDRAVGRL